MDNYGIEIGIVGVVTLAFVQMVKQWNLDKRLIPVVALLSGLAFSLLIDPNGYQWVIKGVLAGAAACGAYSGGKALAGY